MPSTSRHTSERSRETSDDRPAPPRRTVAPAGLVLVALLAALVAFASAFLPGDGFQVLAALTALGTGLVVAGVAGRQRSRLALALFAGVVPSLGVVLAAALTARGPIRELPYLLGTGLTWGLFVAFFGYLVGTVEYWASSSGSSPTRGDVGRLLAVVVLGAALIVGARLYAAAHGPVVYPGLG